jgi:acyl-CoA thioesterase I
LYYNAFAGELSILIFSSDKLFVHQTTSNCTAVVPDALRIWASSSLRTQLVQIQARGYASRLRAASAFILLSLSYVLLPSAAFSQAVATSQDISAALPSASSTADAMATHKQVQDDHCRAGTEALAFNPSLPRARMRLAAGEPLTIVALGSSTTSGVGATNKDRAYPSILDNLMIAGLPSSKVHVVNQGIGSQRAEDMFNRIQDVIAEKPLIVIWQTGVNDAIHNIGADVMRGFLEKGIARLESENIDVVLMGAQWLPRPERYPQYDSYRRVMNEVAAENSVPIFSRYDAMVCLEQGGEIITT